MACIAGAEVTALTDQPTQALRAKELGAVSTISRAQAESDAQSEARFDIVIGTTNTWRDWRTALRLAGQRGVVACLGFPGRGEAAPPFNPLDSQYFYMKQLRLEAVGLSPERSDTRGNLRYNERDNLAFLLKLIETGRLQPAKLISGRYSGLDIPKAYEDLSSRRQSPVTYLLEWNRE
jgi:threonine dehydrogenase-like Zn-dependent dehydrogenase